MKLLKKLSLLALCCGLTAQAQQINGSFDDDWETCTPWTNGGSHAEGTQPKGWCAANVAGMNFAGWKGNTTVVSQVEGRNGSTAAVKMANTPNSYMASMIVPGYLALGTTWSTAKGASGGNADGGTWGGKAFNFKPDAIRFYYQRSASNADSPASVIAYLWKGTYLQASVPCNIGLTSVSTCTMEDRDRNILDMATAQGGAVTQTGTRIAKIETYISNVTSDWTEMTIPFNYETDDTPEKINVIFAANNYFDTNVVNGNTLTIDDVELVYYHELASLKFFGQSLNLEKAASAEGVSMGDLTYDPAQLTYEIKGVGATAEKSYDAATGVLTITVKGNDFSANAESKTDYTVRFAAGGVDPDPDPDPDPEPDPDPDPSVQGLGEPITSLSEITNRKTYVLYNPGYTAYAIYNAEQSPINVWTAGMCDGDDSHKVIDTSYSTPLDPTSESSAWMIVAFNGKYYLYNMGAKKFLVTPEHEPTPAICQFNETPNGLSITELGDGRFAFNSTEDSKGFLCAAPQLAFPLSVWDTHDAGASWQIMENTNIAADLDVLGLIDPSLEPDPEQPGEAVASLEEISMETTYLIYNPTFTAYLTYHAEHAGDQGYVWTAGMVGDADHVLAQENYGEAVDIASPAASWMVLPIEDKFYVYNMGFAKYLTTPGYVDHTSPCVFSDTPVALTVEDLGNATFALTATGHELDYLCAAPQQSASPIGIWRSNDSGACWKFLPNPNVAADAELAKQLTGIRDAILNDVKDGKIYNLSGRYVGHSTKQLTKGVYICNGRKFVVK